MTLLERAKELFDGVCEDDMTHLKGESTYNNNYYIINGNTLLGESDDDNFTQWYWVLEHKCVAIGGSYNSDNDKIIVDRAYQ